MPRREETYTHGHHDSVVAAHAVRTAENSAAYLLEHLRPGMSVLDVGCGPGTITVGLADRVAPGPVVGLDRDAGVLRRTRSGAARANLRYAVGDVYALPVATASVDVVHAHQVLQHLGDPVAALRELHRVLRPGGLLAVRDADYAAMTWYPEDADLTGWNDLYHRVARHNGGEPDAGRRLHAWVRAAGFTDVAASAGTWCFTTVHERAWWAGQWAERVRQSALGEQAVAQGLAEPADLERLAEAWLRWAAAEDGWFVVLHGQVLARRG
ncbi:methyltransferase domain-containing protein [Georgenia ruanii]|uniref:Methyltransferase domain-containing protein n=1 Tax=Georgenia ruanii TaxID=348442 RepID=A0A7J9UZU7_9MICO|nr:methyltransferase domain-containing protein [Georgenia ruanii]MPV90175.1 methyltransferase domain-containing protein [Georgenia ruanii]